MEAPLPDNASSDPLVCGAKRMMRARIVSTVQKVSTKDIPRETKNRRIVLNGDLLITPKTSDYSYIVL